MTKDERKYEALRQQHAVSALLREASGQMSYGNWSSEFRDKVEKSLLGGCEIATESAVENESLRQQLAKASHAHEFMTQHYTALRKRIADMTAERDAYMRDYGM